MTYTLLTGEYAYSSWSMRGWLMLDGFDIPFSPNYFALFTEDFEKMQERNYPACSVPAISFEMDDENVVICDSLAIAETLAERHPDANLWPSDPRTRMFARSMSAQVHSSFQAIKNRSTMNLHARYEGIQPSVAEQKDADSISALWTWALKEFGGPYLCGDAFSVADAMFAPMATRFVTYGFPMTDHVRSYIETIYAYPSFRRWHACADAQLRMLDQLHHDLPSGDVNSWPRKAVLPAKPYSGSVSDAINEFCPYSGKPIVADSLAEIDGLTVGFCKQFCCRRGMADAESWPTVMAVMGR